MTRMQGWAGGGPGGVTTADLGSLSQAVHQALGVTVEGPQHGITFWGWAWQDEGLQLECSDRLGREGARST